MRSEGPDKLSLHCEPLRRGPEMEVTSECLSLRLLEIGISTAGTRVVLAKVTTGGSVMIGGDWKACRVYLPDMFWFNLDERRAVGLGSGAGVGAGGDLRGI